MTTKKKQKKTNKPLTYWSTENPVNPTLSVPFWHPVLHVITSGSAAIWSCKNGLHFSLGSPGC